MTKADIDAVLSLWGNIVMRSGQIALAVCMLLTSCKDRTEPPANNSAADSSSPFSAEVAALKREADRLDALRRQDLSIHSALHEELDKRSKLLKKIAAVCEMEADPTNCAVSAYATRIHNLRIASPATRSADDKGISEGPFDYRCEGLDARVSAVFIKSEPGAASLQWLDRTVTLPRVESTSGAKYSGSSNDGAWAFLTEGDKAVLTTPSKSELNCSRRSVG